MTPEEAKRRRHRNERIAAALFCLAASIAVAIFAAWNRAEEEALRNDSRYIPKPTVVTPEALLLREYVRIDTSNPPGNEIAGARWLAAQLAKHGIAGEIIESAPGRANLYARIRGKRPGEGLLLTHHIDVAPSVTHTWRHPPFEGAISLNMLWGRGAIDMKGMGICHLLAFIDVARAGRQPERDIVFLAVADEESGTSRYGMQWLLERRPELFEGVRYAINEGGITEILNEKPTYFGIEVGTKLMVTARLRGSESQLQRARLALEPFMTSSIPDRLLPEVRAYFQYVAPYRFAVRELLADIDATIRRGELWRLPLGYRELMQNTVVPLGIDRDGDSFVLTTHLYNLPDEDPDARIAWLRQTVAPFGVTVDITRKDLPAPIMSDATPLFRLLRAEARRIHNGVPVGTHLLNNSTNDSRHLRRRGIVAYGVSPFLVDVAGSAGIHGYNERVRLDWFAQGIELTRAVVRRWAFAATPGE